MIDTGSVNIGGRRTGGGGGIGGGGVNQQWVDENYVSKEFFARLFTIHGHDAEDQNDPPTDIVVEPNDADTPIDSIEAMFGLWTEQFLTALGVGSGGSGGGGGALYLLADVVPNDSEDPQYVYGLTGDPQADDGKVLTFSGTFGHWIAAEPQGTGTLQTITVTTPNGMLVNGGQSAVIGETEPVELNITLADGYFLLSEYQYDVIDNFRNCSWWGQSFRSFTNIVYGPMTNVGSIDNLLFFDTQDSTVSIQTGAGALFAFTFNNMVNPMLKMQVYGEIGETVAMLLNGTELLINNNATKNLALYAAQTMLFDTGAVERMRIDSSGNVGIGTSNPAYTLDVNGYTKTNRLYLSANVYLEYDSTNSGIHVVGAGLYSDTFLSALGVGSGGGGVSLEQPLSGINSAGLGAPPSGQQKLLLWNGSAWTYGSPSSGGVGTVTSITAGTGLAGGIITSSGTISIDSTYQTYISHGETAYQNLSNYVQASAIKTLTLQGNGVNVVTFTPNGSSNATFNIEAASRLALTRGTNKVTLDLATISGAQGTYTKVIVDQYGRVSSGIEPSDMTLAAYGITANDTLFGNIAAGSLTTKNKQAWGRTYWTSSGVPTTIKGTITDDYFCLYSHGGNPYLRLGDSNSEWKVQLYNNTLWFGNTTANSLRIDSSGRVGIGGSIAASYKLAVTGSTYLNGISYFNGNVGIGASNDSSYILKVTGAAYATVGIASAGYVTALSQSSSSDLRMKNVIEDIWLKPEQIAEAPMVKFTWKDKADKGVHVGSIAQYWLNVLPEAVPEIDGHYNLEYGTIALIAAISIARKLVNLEQRIARLERSNS